VLNECVKTGPYRARFSLLLARELAGNLVRGDQVLLAAAASAGVSDLRTTLAI
jgi:hypothetical protein